MRINRYLALCGLGARRAVEGLVRAGRVKVDGAVVTDLAFKVPEGARVAVHGKPVAPRRNFRYYAFNKPRGVLTTSRDPEGRRTVQDALPPTLRDLKAIGRLDADTEGLLLLTDDGAFAQRVAHPSFNVVKRYVVVVTGEVTAPEARQMEKGLNLADGHIGRLKVEKATRRGANAVVTVSAHYGRKRMIRGLFELLGHRVLLLRRVAVGPVRLGTLPAGAVRPLSRREVAALSGNE